MNTSNNKRQNGLPWLLLLCSLGLSTGAYAGGISLTNTVSAIMPNSLLVQGVKQNAERVITGTVVDGHNEPLIGVTVRVKGTNVGVVTDLDGHYTLKTNVQNPQLEFSFIGFTPQTIAPGNRSKVDVTLVEDSKQLNEVVVTAMGIQRKEKSLTYATQQVKAEDLMRVQDANVVNNLEGKVSGVTITPSAGGAGGASKIVLRGNKSILGSNTPLIVIDGVPMTNNTQGQKGFGDGESLAYSGSSEGADPLSMVNPDDIESMNVLKGANAAALYGSAAANGVIMITTKKGREGKIGVNYAANITFDSPLLTPKLQNVYGAQMTKTGDIYSLSLGSWGDRIANSPEKITTALDANRFGTGATQDVYLRNYGNDDVDDFYRTGVTVNNSVSVSGGTKNITTYFSFANAHANGMIRNNTYNRNTLAFRQTYQLFDRLKIDASLNYVQTRSKNRPGGGTILNPIYHLYTAARNINMGYYADNYYRDGSWLTNPQSIYTKNADGTYTYGLQQATLKGTMQNWPNMEGGQNNPYWLTDMNRSLKKTDRVYGTVTGVLQIIDGLSFQARVSFDHTKYDGDSRRYATTFLPASMDAYGHYWKDVEWTNEIYTDYLLSYSKNFNNTWDLNATAGWVGHLIKDRTQKTDVEATYYDGSRQSISERFNLFETNSGGPGATSTNKVTNWDKAALFTVQLGWKDRIFVDASYRQDWYRAFKQFKDRGMSSSYGYFGVGANAIISQLAKLPSWISYLKYRASYSEVGNSIPNIVFTKGSIDYKTGAITPSVYSQFANPKPEKTKSFETGIESSFFNAHFDFDFTFYNAISSNQYMVATNASGKSIPVNSGKIRNRGIEMTLGYNFLFGKDWKWKTSVNYSFDDNKILETIYNTDGSEMLVSQDVSGVRVRYSKGGSIGDMYVTDYKRNADGTYAITQDGRLQFESEANKRYGVYVGNMNSKHQLGWSNTFTWKGLQLYFLINGRIGGKVVSLTEGYLDNFGVSERSAQAREYAEQNGLAVDGKPAMYLPDGSNRLVPVESYYKSLGSSKNPIDYIYNATNFRLRELSLGYTFYNLLGAGRNLSLSFIGRNLFFIYKDAPVDPDVSLSTANGLGAFELFNMPSSRSYGFSLKMNF